MKTEVSHSKPCQCPEIYVSSPDNLDPRLDASVESDIVGYTTIQMDAGKWYLLGNPFTALDGSATFKINEVYRDANFGASDILYTLESSGKFTPHYWNATNNGWSKHRVFWQEDVTDYSSSTAIYLKKTSVGELTFAGKVSSMKVDVGTDEGNAWSLTAMTYPKESLLNEFAWENFSNGDLLYTMNEDGDFTPHYWNAANNGWSKHRVFWNEDTEKLKVGQAVYLFKRSVGVGAISKEI